MLDTAVESTTLGQFSAEESTSQSLPDSSPLMADEAKMSNVGIPVSQDEEQLLQHVEKETERELEAPEISPYPSETEAASREAAMQQIAMAEKMAAEQVEPELPSTPSVVKSGGEKKPFIMRILSGIYHDVKAAVGKLLGKPWSWFQSEINTFADKLAGKNQKPRAVSRYSSAALKHDTNASASFKGPTPMPA